MCNAIGKPSFRKQLRDLTFRGPCVVIHVYSYTRVLISPQPDQEGNKLQRQKSLNFIYPIYNHNWRNISTIYIYYKTSIKRNILTIKQNTGVLISPQPDQEGNKLQRQKSLIFIYLFIIIIGEILILFIYITRLASNEIF